MSMHVCRSTVEPAPRLYRRVCGCCELVHEGCLCYAVSDAGRAMRENASGTWWSAFLGLDLRNAKWLGEFKTRREAAAAILKAAGR